MNQQELEIVYGVNNKRSLDLGHEFAQAWRSNNLSDVVDTLNAYIEARRKIPINPNTGKRYGSYDAYCATQGHYI